MSKTTIAIGYNPFVNRIWVAKQIISIVKEGTNDVYVVVNDDRTSKELMETINELIKGDEQYQQHKTKNSVQIHLVKEDMIEELSEVDLSDSAVVTHNVFTKSVRKLKTLFGNTKQLTIHTRPASVSETDIKDSHFTTI